MNNVPNANVNFINYRSCEVSSCKKMRLVIGHFLSCKKMSNSLSCTVCNQMLKVINKHADYCNSEDQEACPVPLCDSIRGEKINSNNNNDCNNTMVKFTGAIVDPARG